MGPGRAAQVNYWDVLDKIIDNTNKESFDEVQLLVLLLTLVHTFSRAECPCPKSYSGRESYAYEEHWSVDDFDIVTFFGSRRATGVRFGAIKQDKKIERPEARGNNDWAYVGEIPGSKWCLMHWLLKLNHMHGPRDAKAPMFVHSKGSIQPLLYRVALSKFKAAQRAVGVEEGEEAGLHGARVLGYTLTRRGLGEDVAKAHGLWSSNAHDRYHRFDMRQILRIPSVIAGVDSGASASDLSEREARPPSTRLGRHDGPPETTSDTTLALPRPLLPD